MEVLINSANYHMVHPPCTLFVHWVWYTATTGSASCTRFPSKAVLIFGTMYVTAFNHQSHATCPVSLVMALQNNLELWKAEGWAYWSYGHTSITYIIHYPGRKPADLLDGENLSPNFECYFKGGSIFFFGPHGGPPHPTCYHIREYFMWYSLL